LKDKQLIYLLEQTAAPMSLSDATVEDLPLVAVNRRFEVLTGYRGSEVVGKNCRFLQDNMPQIEERKIIRDAISKEQEAQVVLRNVRKNGEQFDNLLFLFPLREHGDIKYYMGSQFALTGTDLIARSSKRADQLTAALRDMQESNYKIFESNRQLIANSAALAVSNYLRTKPV